MLRRKSAEKAILPKKEWNSNHRLCHNKITCECYFENCSIRLNSLMTRSSYFFQSGTRTKKSWPPLKLFAGTKPRSTGCTKVSRVLQFALQNVFVHLKRNVIGVAADVVVVGVVVLLLLLLLLLLLKGM
jgi:hypothetical protein